MNPTKFIVPFVLSFTFTSNGFGRFLIQGYEISKIAFDLTKLRATFLCICKFSLTENIRSINVKEEALAFCKTEKSVPKLSPQQICRR